jgi:peptidoglycan L-alanyl-D-glutamate endopeptidase CwlK
MSQKYHFGKTSLKRMEGLDERLIKILNIAIKETNQDFSVIEGVRTAERQHQLYLEGQSELDGYNKKSMHQFGKAVDIAPYKNGKLIWGIEEDPAAWLEIGRAMLRAARLTGVCLEWGLTYNIGNGVDAPHFQIKE